MRAFLTLSLTITLLRREGSFIATFQDSDERRGSVMSYSPMVASSNPYPNNPFSKKKREKRRTSKAAAEARKHWAIQESMGATQKWMISPNGGVLSINGLNEGYKS